MTGRSWNARAPKRVPNRSNYKFINKINTEWRRERPLIYSPTLFNNIQIMFENQITKSNFSPMLSCAVR